MKDAIQGCEKTADYDSGSISRSNQFYNSEYRGPILLLVAFLQVPCKLESIVCCLASFWTQLSNLCWHMCPCKRHVQACILFMIVASLLLMSTSSTAPKVESGMAVV